MSMLVAQKLKFNLNPLSVRGGGTSCCIALQFPSWLSSASECLNGLSSVTGD